MPVMESLELFALPLQHGGARKPLPPEEVFIVRIVEALDHAVSPRFPYRDKHRCNTKMETQPDHQTKRPGMTIAAPE